MVVLRAGGGFDEYAISNRYQRSESSAQRLDAFRCVENPAQCRRHQRLVGALQANPKISVDIEPRGANVVAEHFGERWQRPVANLETGRRAKSAARLVIK